MLGDSVDTLVDRAKEVLERSRREGRVATTEERREAERCIERAKQMQAERDLSLSLGGSLGAVKAGGAPLMQNLTPGEAFVQSDGFKSIQDPTRRPERWSTGLIEARSSLGLKGTLMEAPGGGAGALAATVPQVVPGVVQKLFAPLTLEGLLMSGQATTNAVRYVRQGTADSAAAGVAEGGTKPESTIGYVVADEPIRKIATFLPISDEALEDAPAIQQAINGTLSLFVQMEAERQLLRGTAGGDEVQGLLTARGVPVRVTGTADGNIAEQLFRAANSMRGSAFVEPDWIIIDPSDYEKVRLLKDNTGQLMGGGPFMGQYGNGGLAGDAWTGGGAIDTLWGKPLYVTPAVGPGTAIIGTKAGGQVWSRGGTRVEASNSHLDWFQTNMVALRAERRLGLCIYRSDSYVEVRGLA